MVAKVAAALLNARWFVRAPILLYRARLGFVFGHRLLMVEHVGRVSGLQRYVVLEVVSHPTRSTYIVVSGFGERAQWLRNIAANPEVRISVAGRKPAPAHAERLGGQGAAEALTWYAEEHPRSWAKLRPILEQTLGAQIDLEATNLPVIAFELR